MLRVALPSLPNLGGRALYGDVFEISSPTVHRDAHAHLRQREDPGRSRELAALIRIYYLGRAVFGRGLTQCFNADMERQAIDAVD